MPQITLIAYEHDDDVAIRMIPQLLQPPRHVFKCLVLADVIDEESADSATVVGGCDGAVALLAGRVPDLSLDGLGVDLDGTGRELDTNGGLGVDVELVTGESAQKVGLYDTRVSNQDDC